MGHIPGLREQLKRIADTHHGLAPLHGRLFAQWMHYAFPQECPFPHQSGKAQARTPQEFGDGYMATAHEMRKHTRTKLNSQPRNLTTEEQWGMGAWLREEELLTDYVELRPAGTGLRWPLAAALLGLLALFARSLPISALVQKNDKPGANGFGGLTMKQYSV